MRYSIIMNIFSEIKSKISLVDVLNYYGIEVENNKALCPYHDDHKSSLSVKDNRWRCWVCNLGGSALDWVAMYEGVDILTAAKILDCRYGFGLSSEKPSKTQINKYQQSRDYVYCFEQEYMDKMMEYAKAMRTMDRLRKEIRPITAPLCEFRKFVDDNYEQMDYIFHEFSLHIDFKEKFKIFKSANLYLSKMRELNLI